MLFTAKMIVLINIFVCFFIPPIVTIIISPKRKVFLPYLLGILTCLLANSVIKAFWSRFIFNRMESFINLQYGFFGDVIFYPLFDAAVSVMVILLLLLLARCHGNLWKMIAYALGYSWINNILACGKNQVDMLLDWLQPGDAVYPVNVETLIVILISMLLNSCVFFGIALMVQTGYISGELIKYILLALSMQYLVNMLYPLFTNWFGFSFWGVTFLRFAATLTLVIYGCYRYNQKRSLAGDSWEEEA